MFIHGREVKFRLDVDAITRIAELCPDEDLQKLSVILNKGYASTQRVLFKMGVIMSESYEDNETFEGREAHKPLTEQEARHMTMDEAAQLTEAIMAAWTDGQKTSVETKPAEKTKK